MPLELQINNSDDPAARYVAMAPSPCRVRATGAGSDTRVVLSSRAARANGGQVVFYTAPHADPPTDSLTLSLPEDGGWVDFWIGGKWGHPSVDDRDCLLEANAPGMPTLAVTLMVRVRKNANDLLPRERNRFLDVLARLNNFGDGLYQTFRDLHVEASDAEEHGGPHFLPWHRAYLLDLEREMQKLDPAVSLHYWRFDQPAPNVFQANFMGATRQITMADEPSLVELEAGHPLTGWRTDNDEGILRSALFDTLNSAARGAPPEPPRRPDWYAVISQAETLRLGADYDQFRGMEGRPHGAAHVSFRGWIDDIPTAAKDPLFFLLHCNVDRLWALWQWYYQRTNFSEAGTYVEGDIDGRRLSDTLWPWNGVCTAPRPPFAPRGDFAGSPTVEVPGPQPYLRNMIDYQGRTAAHDRLGYGYDSVPYQLT